MTDAVLAAVLAIAVLAFQLRSDDGAMVDMATVRRRVRNTIRLGQYMLMAAGAIAIVAVGTYLVAAGHGGDPAPAAPASPAAPAKAAR